MGGHYSVYRSWIGGGYEKTLIYEKFHSYFTGEYTDSTKKIRNEM